MSNKTYLIESTLADYTAEEFSSVYNKLITQGIFNNSGDGTDLRVQEKGVPDMSVDVKLGACLVEITKATVSWMTINESNAITNIVIPDNAGGTNRVDAIIVRVDVDTEPNALKNNIMTIERVAGTGATALSDGAIQTAIGDDGFYRLANITVTPAATEIYDADIEDTRVIVKVENIDLDADNVNANYTKSFKHLWRGYATDPLPADLVEGDMWYNTTDDLIKYFDGTSILPLSIGDPDAATRTMVREGELIYAADSGGSDSYAISLSPAATGYVTGMVIHFKANTANTGSATLNINSLGAKTIKKHHDQDLDDNDIESGQIVTVVYDGTNFQMQSQKGNPNFYKTGNATWNGSSSGSQVISGIGFKPKMIVFRAAAVRYAGASRVVSTSHGAFDGTNNSCLQIYDSEFSPELNTSRSNDRCIDTRNRNASPDETIYNYAAVTAVSIDSFTLTWTHSGVGGNAIDFQWEVYG